MKKLWFVAAAALLWVLPTSALAGEAPDIRVFVNGEAMVFDAAPIVVNDRVLVPVRGIMEKLGAEVEYDAHTREVDVRMNELELRMTLDGKEVGINAATTNLDALPIIRNDRLMVPLRFVSEYLGYDVEWNGEERVVTIRDPGEAYRSLYRAYLRHYDVPFVSGELVEEGMVLYEPQSAAPFSFSGLFEFRVEPGNGYGEIVVNGESSGRRIDDKFVQFMQGYLNERGETGQFRHEFVQDLVTGETYRDEGGGFSRYPAYNRFQLDEQSGYAQYILAFLMLNHDKVEIQTTRLEGRTKKVFSIDVDMQNSRLTRPLLGIIASHADIFPFPEWEVEGQPAQPGSSLPGQEEEGAGSGLPGQEEEGAGSGLPDKEEQRGLMEGRGQDDWRVHAEISVTLDGESMRIENTDVVATFGNGQESAAYTAIYHYLYENIAPIGEVGATDSVR